MRSPKVNKALTTLIALVEDLTGDSDERQVLSFMIGKVAAFGEGSNRFGLNYGSSCFPPFLLDEALELEPWTGAGGRGDPERLKRNRQRITTAAEDLEERGLIVMEPVNIGGTAMQRFLNDMPCWRLRLNI